MEVKDDVEKKEGNETLDHSDDQGSNENNNEGGFKFDPNAFMNDSNEDGSSKEDEQNANESNSENGSDSTNDDSEGDNTNDHASWDSMSGSADSQGGQSQEEKSQDEADGDNTNATSDNDLKRNAQSDEANEEAGSENLDYTSIASRLGVEEATTEKVNQQIDLLIKENEELKRYRTEGVNNEAIDNYSKLKKLSDEELIRVSLEAEDLSKEDIEKQLEIFESNDSVVLEANRVRRRLDGAISKEQGAIEQRSKDSENEEILADQKNKDLLRETLNSTDTMFGMKMTKDPEKLDSVRKDHFKYITEGEFAKDIGADPQNMMEIAWLWKHREGILSQMTSQGKNEARKEMVNMFENVDANSSSSGVLPPNPNDSKGDFDPSKFMETK